jgi:hypothetical protein
MITVLSWPLKVLSGTIQSLTILGDTFTSTYGVITHIQHVGHTRTHPPCHYDLLVWLSACTLQQPCEKWAVCSFQDPGMQMNIQFNEDTYRFLTQHPLPLIVGMVYCLRVQRTMCSIWESQMQTRTGWSLSEMCVHGMFDPVKVHSSCEVSDISLIKKVTNLMPEDDRAQSFVSSYQVATQHAVQKLGVNQLCGGSQKCPFHNLVLKSMPDIMGYIKSTRTKTTF